MEDDEKQETQEKSESSGCIPFVIMFSCLLLFLHFFKGTEIGGVILVSVIGLIIFLWLGSLVSTHGISDVILGIVIFCIAAFMLSMCSGGKISPNYNNEHIRR